jgi:glycosyltransferase involved in cell wall biosynthesis
VVAVRSAPASYGNGPKVRLDQWFARHYASAVVSNSSSADALWAGLLAPERMRGVIRNALPLDGLDGVPPADPRQLGFPADLPLVVYVGRMHPDKGIDTLLEALECVNAERPISALLLGVGELLDGVRERLKDPGFGGRAAAPGFRLDATAWLKRAAVFVSLSRHEGMPNTVMEAMALRCPAVVSDIPQHREILDDASALFVPLDDAAATAAAIRRTLDAPVESAARAARARGAAEGWSIDATSGAWAGLYDRLLS